MKDSEEIVRLREISDMAHEITQSDKLYLRKIAAREGVEFEPCRTCPDKWQDLAMELYAKLRKQEPAAAGVYKLREGVDVRYMGWRVNEATLTDELAQKLVAYGFPVKFFAQVPNAD